eukprot:2201308-Prymnesium_polylepis.2
MLARRCDGPAALSRKRSPPTSIAAPSASQATTTNCETLRRLPCDACGPVTKQCAADAARRAGLGISAR